MSAGGTSSLFSGLGITFNNFNSNVGSVTDLHARRLYVGGVPLTANEASIVKFLNDTLIKAKGNLDEGNPIIKSVNNPEKRFIFLELRCVEETSAMIQLDGIRL